MTHIIILIMGVNLYKMKKIYNPLLLLLCLILWGCGVWESSHPCVFTIFHSKSFFKKWKLDIYKCPFLEILKYFWKIDDL